MSDRLEREIEEILDKIEQFPSPESRRARARRQFFRRIGSSIAERQRAFASQLGRISMSQVMLASFLLILGALFFRRFGIVSEWLLWGGVILFVVSFAILVFSRRTPSAATEERWRGRPIQHTQRYPTLAERIRMWWRRRARR